MGTYIRASEAKPGDRLTGALGGTLTLREVTVIDACRTAFKVRDDHGNCFGYVIHPDRLVEKEND